MAIHLTYKISNPKNSFVHTPKTFIAALLIHALDNLLLMKLHLNHRLMEVHFELVRVLETILQARKKFHVVVITKLNNKKLIA
jgi:hypothetical protein